MERKNRCYISQWLGKFFSLIELSLRTIYQYLFAKIYLHNESHETKMK